MEKVTNPVNNTQSNPGEQKVASYSGPVEWETKEIGHEKVALNISPSVRKAVGSIGNSAAITIGSAAGLGIANWAYGAMKEQLFDAPEFEASFQKCLEINPRLRSYPEKDLRAYFNMVAEASPSVAKNPLLAAQYLQHLLSYKGTINFSAYNDLVKLEGQLVKNRNETNALTGIAQKAMIEGAMKGIVGPGSRNNH